jgi:HAD superfamily hydrolase (TIGR01509 family)
MQRFDAVIFDMDGLLLDSERLAQDAFIAVCDSLGIKVDLLVFQRCIGTNEALSSQILQDGLPASVDVTSFREQWVTIYHGLTNDKKIPVKEGVTELLDYLHTLRIPAAVATSTRTAAATQKLHNAGLLDAFEQLVGGDQVSNSKPHPAIYQRAARLLGAPAENCLAFEDSENGVKAAVAAQCTVIQIPDLVQPSDALLELGHVVLQSLLDVPTYKFPDQ